MAPLPRPFLRFAVGTTLLVPVVGTGCDNDPPPTVNTPAPEPAQPPESKPVEPVDSGAAPDPHMPTPVTNLVPDSDPELNPEPSKPILHPPEPKPDPPQPIINTPKPQPKPEPKPHINTPKPKPEPKPKLHPPPPT